MLVGEGIFPCDCWADFGLVGSYCNSNEYCNVGVQMCGQSCCMTISTDVR